MRRIHKFRTSRHGLAGMACLATAVMVLSLGTGCSKASGNDDESSGAKETAAPAAVTVTEVKRADISRVLQLTGSLSAVPNRDVKVSSLVPGRITNLEVAEGDKVTRGQVLAKIDDAPIRDQLTQAQATLAQALANEENAKLNLARDEDLVQRGIAARKELEDARTQESVAQAGVRQAQAAVSIAELQLTRTSIASPITGTVLKRYVSNGEQVDGTAATPIAEVASLDEADMMANVPVADLVRMKPGRELQLTSASIPGRVYKGQVVGVSQAVDPTSNSGLVRIRIKNSGGDLRIGMFLGAQIPVETHVKALTVSPQAIYRDQEGMLRVFRAEGDTAIAVPVTLGIETPELAEILSGVKEGDKLILTGGYGLEDKAKIIVQAPGDNKAASPAPAKPGSEKP